MTEQKGCGIARNGINVPSMLKVWDRSNSRMLRLIVLRLWSGFERTRPHEMRKTNRSERRPLILDSRYGTLNSHSLTLRVLSLARFQERNDTLYCCMFFANCEPWLCRKMARDCELIRAPSVMHTKVAQESCSQISASLFFGMDHIMWWNECCARKVLFLKTPAWSGYSDAVLRFHRLWHAHHSIVTFYLHFSVTRGPWN